MRLSSKDQISGSYSFEDRPHILPGTMPLSGVDFPLRNQLLTLSETHIFSPNIVNVGRFGYNRTKTFKACPNRQWAGLTPTLCLGFRTPLPTPFDYGIPDATFNGFTSVGSISEAIGATDGDFEFTTT